MAVKTHLTTITVSASLVLDSATRTFDFYRDAFAGERFRLPMGEKMGRAESRISDTILMPSDE